MTKKMKREKKSKIVEEDSCISPSRFSRQEYASEHHQQLCRPLCFVCPFSPHINTHTQPHTAFAFSNKMNADCMCSIRYSRLRTIHTIYIVRLRRIAHGIRYSTCEEGGGQGITEHSKHALALLLTTGPKSYAVIYALLCIYINVY